MARLRITQVRSVITQTQSHRGTMRALGLRREEIAQAARRVVLGLWQGEAGPRPAKANCTT